MDLDFHWIEEHFKDDPSKLRLKYGKEHAADILQIEMRRKHSAKFERTLEANPQFIFPTSLAAEQATSDRISAFHASLISDGREVVDLTAGLGGDCRAFAAKATRVVAVERDELLADVLKQNSANFHNISVVNEDCEQYLKSCPGADVAFIDPARRDEKGGRVFALKDCSPNVIELLPMIESKFRELIIKASPMLDITHSVSEIGPSVRTVIALGTPTECKELDFICVFDDKAPEKIDIKAVTVGSDFMSEFSFTEQEEAAGKSLFGVPQAGQYIYDPYPSVMKAGPFKLLGSKFGIKKIGSNTHLWFADTVIDDFPGSIYRIVEVLPYMSKHIKRYASRFPRVSVTARNFDISSDALRAKLSVKDGELRLFAVNAFDGRKLLITCEKI